MPKDSEPIATLSPPRPSPWPRRRPPLPQSSPALPPPPSRHVVSAELRASSARCSSSTFFSSFLLFLVLVSEGKLEHPAQCPEGRTSEAGAGPPCSNPSVQGVPARLPGTPLSLEPAWRRTPGSCKSLSSPPLLLAVLRPQVSSQ